MKVTGVNLAVSESLTAEAAMLENGADTNVMKQSLGQIKVLHLTLQQRAVSVSSVSIAHD